MSRCIARIAFFVGTEGEDGKRKEKLDLGRNDLPPRHCT